MSELSDLVVDGLVCEGCGGELGNESDVKPTLCSSCQEKDEQAFVGSAAAYSTISGENSDGIGSDVEVYNYRPVFGIDLKHPVCLKFKWNDKDEDMVDDDGPGDPVYLSRAQAEKLGRALLKASKA